MVQIEPTEERMQHQIDYQQLIEIMPIAVYTCDANGYVTSFNKLAIELWGREPKPGEDRWCGAWKLYEKNGADLSMEDCPMAEAIREGHPNNGQEFIVETPKGKRTLVLPNSKPLYDGAGKIAGSMHILEDVTERRANEDSLARLASIVANSNDAIIGYTLNRIVTSWNAAAERIYGYTAAEMIDESLNKIVPKDLRDEERDIIRRISEGEHIEHFETRRLTKDNRMLDVSITSSPIRNSRGEITGASKIARDITEEKQKERTLHQVEARIKMAIEATKLGTWDYCPQSGDILWSAECRSIFDLPSHVPETYDLFMELVHPDDVATVKDAIGAAMSPDGNGICDVYFRIQRYTDRHLRWVRAQGRVYFDQQRMPERFVGTVLDITEDKERKEELVKLVMHRTKELQKANEKLHRTNKELEQFAYTISHDLQEPLRKIQGFAESLATKARTSLDAEMQVYLDKIIKSSSEMSVQIKELLGYAHINATTQQFVMVDLNKTLQSAREDLKPAIQKDNAIIHSDRLPEIEALPQQMHQLFYNLISNSLKFRAPERTPVIIINSKSLSRGEITELQLDSKKEYYKIDFSDNGMGFDPKHNAQLFSLFQRLNNREEYAGTGVGLALCKKITDIHKGSLMAKGKENRGAKFTVILPATQ